ncbi:MAG: HD domain-containing phosphohydrolase [Fidelibacterota bacterium]
MAGNSEDRKILESHLNQWGYIVDLVPDGEDALKYLSSKRPLMVISSLSLPGMDGYELCRTIKEDDRLNTVPIILISDSEEGPDKVLGMQSRADDYVTKPINANELKNRISALLNRKTDTELKDDVFESKFNDNLKVVEDTKKPEEESFDKFWEEDLSTMEEEIEEKPATEEGFIPPKREVLGFDEEVIFDEEEITEEKEAADDLTASRADYNLYSKIGKDVEEFFTTARTNGRFDYAKLIEDAKNLVNAVNVRNYMQIKAMSRRESASIPYHCLNVAIFAVKVAMGLNFNDKQLKELCLASIVHDIGMVRLSDDIVNAEGKLTDEQFREVKRHPRYGAEIILKAVKEDMNIRNYPFIPEVIYQEHERENGSGYPRGLKGNEIHPYAKIIGMVDTYEALSHPRSYRKDFIAYEALQKVIAMKNTLFEIKIIKALIKQISIFPLESYVKLNNGEIGKVIKTNYSHPMRPTIEVVFSASGQKLDEKKILNLVDTPFLFIEKPIYEDELEKEA